MVRSFNRRRQVGLVAITVMAALALSGCGKGGGNSAASSVGGPVGGDVTMDVTHFVNSHATSQSPDLAAHYIDFSFNYPKGWTIDPATGTATASNFIKVVRKDANQTDIESFAVGTYHGTGNPAQDQTLIPQLLDQLDSQFASALPGYHQIDTGTTTIAGQQVMQRRFAGATTLGSKPLNFYGKIIVVPGPAGNTNGVLMLLLATDVSGEFHSVVDVGVKGQTPVALSSFKFGG